ncbi:MAG: hypothetical protein WC444_04200 [Candidatus Paceibacterota bacterium]
MNTKMINKTVREACWKCEGSGKIRIGKSWELHECDNCHGTGFEPPRRADDEEDCPHCRGTGRIKKQHRDQPADYNNVKKTIYTCPSKSISVDSWKEPFNSPNKALK